MTEQQEHAATESGVPNHNPFETLGYPSLSFKTSDVELGGRLKYRVRVTGQPEWVRCVDEKGRPANWKNDDGTPGNPKMAAVTEVQVVAVTRVNPKTGKGNPEPVTGVDDPDDWMRSVWAVKPSSLYHAIRNAVKNAPPIGFGDILEIEHYDDGPQPTSKTESRQKLYRATRELAPADDQPPF